MKIMITCDCGEQVELKPDDDYSERMRKGEILDIWSEWSIINIDCPKCKKHDTFDVNGY